MHYVILLLMWFTPAAIAGALGWKGVWGGGSAFFDYLIPIPVAGGVFHVPSFAVAALIIVSLKKWPEATVKFVGLTAIGVCLAAQTVQLDFERLNAWLFTDYQPARSPLRFGKNPLLLFVATDALWVAGYSILTSAGLRWMHYLLLLSVPTAIVAFQAYAYRIGEVRFEYGFSQPQEKHGNSIAMVYTASAYDEKLFRQWWEADEIILRPWDTQNTENLAVHFSKSMQDIKWGRTEPTNVVATFCVHEEDRSLTTHAGYHDCFAGRITFRDKLGRSLDETVTGLGREVDQWFAGAKLCEGVDIPDNARSSDIELLDLCIGLKHGHDGLLERLGKQYGEESEQVAFIKAHRHMLGLAGKR
jgi:hypothetical protein